MTQLFFLSGLPRTGSTLLASILNQHPQIHASGTSPLADLLCETDRALNALRQQYVLDRADQEFNLYQGILNSFYAHINRPIVFDKHRGWPRNAPVLSRFFQDPKIICTVRPIAEIIASYITVILKHPNAPNFVDALLHERQLPLTIENRAKLLWDEYVQDPYQSMLAGLRSSPRQMLCINYADLVTKPLDVLERIFDFTGIDGYDDFNFGQLRNLTPEKDLEGWGMTGLHDIRPELKATSRAPAELLGATLVEHFRQFDLPF